jgi:hypothetical protein
VGLLSARTKRSIIPKLEEDESPEGVEEFESEVKSLLESDVESETVEEQELVYEFEEETESGAEYSLVNEEELGLDELPGMDAADEEFSVITDRYGGIDRVGVGSDGNVTIENSAGMEETYFLAGAFDGQAVIKDDTGTIWRYDTQEEQLQYRNANQGEWFESDSERHKAKVDKVVDFQQQLWALKRARNEVKDWNHSERDKGKRDRLKSRFDTVMRQLAFNGKYEANETATRGGAARGEDVLNDFQEASKRFRAYGLLQYGIDALDEVEVAEDSSIVEYSPKDF